MSENVKRLLAALIDYYIICFLCTAFLGVITLGRFSATPFSITVYVVMCFVLLLMKDLVFKNASVGKRIFKLKIIKVDGTELKAPDVIKRNISVILLLPLEMIVTLVNNRRIGDIWAKTSVVLAHK